MPPTGVIQRKKLIAAAKHIVPAKSLKLGDSTWQGAATRRTRRGRYIGNLRSCNHQGSPGGALRRHFWTGRSGSQDRPGRHQ